MGILDPKKRVVDIVMTPLGRESLSRNGLSVAYASFTDGQAYYDKSSITGSYDEATDRIYLESPSSLPQDLLALITDDTGDLIPGFVFGSNSESGDDAKSGFKIGTDGTVYEIYNGSRPLSGLNPDANFSSVMSSVANMFQKSFEKNVIIGTRDPIDDDTDFIISPQEATFQTPNDTEEFPVSSINSVDSLFFDKRFANQPQFKFLPPVVAGPQNSEKPIANFRNIKRFNRYTYEDIKEEVIGTDRNPVKQRAVIDFSETSLENDLIMQMYEINTGGIIKLDAVDFGNVLDTSDSARPLKRVIFFGKVYLDDSETATYVNLFTMVID